MLCGVLFAWNGTSAGRPGEFGVGMQPMAAFTVVRGFSCRCGGMMGWATVKSSVYTFAVEILTNRSRME
jgi:hypothetical protein